MDNPNLNLLANSNDSQLIVIDMQARLTGVMSGPDMLVKNCHRLMTAAGILQIPAIVTQQYPKGLGETEPQLLELVRNSTREIPVIDKTCFSCHGSAEFQSSINSNNKQQVILCGIEAHVCVLQTAMDLIREGRTVFVVADAVDSRSPTNKQLALQRISSAGGIVSTTESVLFEWLKDSSHAHFKPVTALIR